MNATIPLHFPNIRSLKKETKGLINLILEWDNE